MFNNLFLTSIFVFSVAAQSSMAASNLQSLAQSSTTNGGQTAIPSVQVPHSAEDMLKLASEMNGLDVPSAHPWHVKISYDQFDEDGDNVHSGTLEEFHFDQKKFKRIYTSDAVTRTDIANGTGLYRVGDQRWPNAVEAEVLNVAFHPLFLAHWDEHAQKPEKTETKLGNSKFPCVTFREKDSNVKRIGAPMFCFEPETVMLRYISVNLAEAIEYNTLTPFQAHYVARDIFVLRQGKVFLKIHIEQLGEITQINDAFFIPPPESKGPLGGRIPVPSSTYVNEYRISSAPPAYPRGVDGKVNVKYVVGKDGNVIEATASEGPESLRKAVLDAVRKYKFRPYLILDQPVEVECSESFMLNSR